MNALLQAANAPVPTQQNALALHQAQAQPEQSQNEFEAMFQALSPEEKAQVLQRLAQPFTGESAPMSPQMLNEYDPASRERLLNTPSELQAPPQGYSPYDALGGGSGTDRVDGQAKDDLLTQQSASPNYPATDRSFGVGGAVRELANKGYDVLGAEQPFPDVARTQANFDVLSERVMSDISSAYDRPPSWLLQRMQNLTPKAGSPFQGAGQAQEKLRALQQDIEGEIETIKRTLGTNLTGSQEGNQNTRLEAMNSALSRVNEAISSFDQPTQEMNTTKGGVKWRIAQ